MTTIKPYGTWTPLVTPKEIYADAIGLGSPKLIGEDLFYGEMRPAEKGRTVLVKVNKKGKVDITPKGFYIRTRVHEYGGKSAAINKTHIYFANFQDQRLYKQELKENSKPIPITPKKNKDGSLGKYGALVISPDNKTLAFIYEKEFEKKENENYIALLDLTKEGENEPTILCKGYDFYLDPVFSKDGKKLAWLQYNHPWLPWNSTEIWFADFNNNKLTNKIKIAGDEKTSICEPKFDSKNNLYFSMDHKDKEDNDPKNYWNLYKYDGKVTQITKDKVEFSGPYWQFGACTFEFLNDNKIIATIEDMGIGKLVTVDTNNGKITELNLDIDEAGSFFIINENKFLCSGSSTNSVSGLYEIDLKTKKTKLLAKSSNIKIDKNEISEPELIKYPTSRDEFAYANYYPPKNSKFKAPENTKPPLLVLVHGGPTSKSHRGFSIKRQFWTSMGWALVDIDYRGSNGYGRKYRDKLNGEWGEIDADDNANAARYLIKKGLADENKIAITGGSAGGYAVQRGLTRDGDVFKTGASYFGIGSIKTCFDDTHKFESKYELTLIGKSYEEDPALWEDRSPINHLDKLKHPMILFQGSEDKIVPPETSREVAEALKKKGLFYEYYEYEGEAHGFRKKENLIESLEKEVEFYKKVLKLE